MPKNSTDSTGSLEIDQNNNKNDDIDESGYKFIQEDKWKWCFFYGTYIFNTAIRSLFSLLFLGQGTGFRWLIAGAVFSTLFGDLITSGWVSYQSDRMETTKYGLGYRKYYLAVSLILSVIGSLGLAIGIPSNNSLRGVLFIIFGTISYCGQAISENIRTPYLIENTSCQAEYVKLNSYYLVPTGIVSAIICVVVFQVSPIAAVLVGFLCMFFGMYYLYKLPEIPNRKDKQPELIPAIRITIDNPVGSKLLYANFFISLSQAFDGLVIQLIQLNFSLLLTVADLSLLIIVGFFISIPVICFSLYRFKVDLEASGGDKYEMVLWASKSLMVCYAIGFIVACMAYYERNVVFLFLVLAFIFVVYFKLYQTLALNVMIRDACYLDTMYTGINRFSLYNMAITRPGAIVLTIVGSLLFTLLRLTGYEELEDDDLDDNIDTRIDYTEETIWYLRFVTMIGPFILTGIACYIFLYFPLDEIRSKKLDSLVTKKLKDKEDAVGEGDKERGSFLGQGVAEAGKRLSIDATESGTGTNTEQKNPLNNDVKIASDSSEGNNVFSSDTITSMLHLSMGELNELANPSMITPSVLKGMSNFNTANVILPVITSLYIVAFIIFCFAIGFFDTIDIQALVLIVVALIGLYHSLRFNILSMLKGLPLHDVRKLAVAGKTARIESNSFLQKVLDDLKNEGTKSERTISATKQLSAWFNTNNDGNIISSKWLNLVILCFSITTLTVYIAISAYYFSYA